MKSLAIILCSFLSSGVFSSCEKTTNTDLKAVDQSAESTPNFLEKEVSPEAQRHIKELVTSYAKGKPYREKIIYNRGEVISIAEPILFSIFGKESVVEQRPYFVCQVDTYWYISGTIPEDTEERQSDGSVLFKVNQGGVWEIILDATDCRVVYLNATE